MLRVSSNRPARPAVRVSQRARESRACRCAGRRGTSSLRSCRRRPRGALTGRPVPGSWRADVPHDSGDALDLMAQHVGDLGRAVADAASRGRGPGGRVTSSATPRDRGGSGATLRRCSCWSTQPTSWARARTGGGATAPVPPRGSCGGWPPCPGRSSTVPSSSRSRSCWRGRRARALHLGRVRCASFTPSAPGTTRSRRCAGAAWSWSPPTEPLVPAPAPPEPRSCHLGVCSAPLSGELPESRTSCTPCVLRREPRLRESRPSPPTARPRRGRRSSAGHAQEGNGDDVLSANASSADGSWKPCIAPRHRPSVGDHPRHAASAFDAGVADGRAHATHHAGHPGRAEQADRDHARRHRRDRLWRAARRG